MFLDIEITKGGFAETEAGIKGGIFGESRIWRIDSKVRLGGAKMELSIGKYGS